MSKYEIYRLDDNYYFPSNDVTFNPYGIWINDQLTKIEGGRVSQKIHTLYKYQTDIGESK